MKAVQNLLRDRCVDERAVFVFPTDVACQKWADWTVENTETHAVSMERFIGWDMFKGSRLRTGTDNLSAVPALMRDIFSRWLIEKNSAGHFFTAIINDRFADSSQSLSCWISSVLPSLHLWKRMREIQKGRRNIPFGDSAEERELQSFYSEYRESEFSDSEDKDLERIFSEYSAFLDENNLFDPAWAEPEFTGDGNEYYIICPEILEDWEQYRERLSRQPTVHLVHAPCDDGRYGSVFFDNARIEIRDAALFLRKKHDEDGVEWSQMAVSVPNMDAYGSYLSRELELYGIPCSVRSSRRLSSYGAGMFFSHLQECFSTQFSYDSLKNLLLNEDIPWLGRHVIDNLLEFGRMNNCICTAGNKKSRSGRMMTVWDDAFENPREDGRDRLHGDELIRALYKNLVERGSDFVNAGSFSELCAAYESFRGMFFDMARFKEMPLNDSVFSRCISAMNELADLEHEFPMYKIASPFSFFVEHLSSVMYLAQGEPRAVQVYPYRTAAPAPYKVHVVVGASQDALSVASLFKPLAFLNDNKRKLFMKIAAGENSLSFTDADPSLTFIRLYQHCALEGAYFTASRHSFGGEYGFAHGGLSETAEIAPEEAARADKYLDEKRRFAVERTGCFGGSIYEAQLKGIRSWVNAQLGSGDDTGLFEMNDSLMSLIKKRLFWSESGLIHGTAVPTERFSISQTTLRHYFKCPRKWLFNDILSISAPDNGVRLIDDFILGTVNHKIFELFFKRIKKADDVLGADGNDAGQLSVRHRNFLVGAINEAVDMSENDSAFRNSFGACSSSTLTIRMICSQYRISDAESPEQNQNFRMLESSLARLSSQFSGYSVCALEREVRALPPDGIGEFYFYGKIDMILASPDGAFSVIDFKTTAIPKNIRCTERKAGRPDPVIDFQLPLYVYALENNIVEADRMYVSSALFYSIRDEKSEFFIQESGGSDSEEHAGSDASESGGTKNHNTLLEITELVDRAARFVRDISDGTFAVDIRNQSCAVCTNKSQFDNCIDYQAVCRRYFTVSGEKL